MKLASFLMQSRGPVNLAKRIPTIVTRFGVSERKIDECLNRFVDIAGESGARPTLAITANLLDRYPDLVRRLSNRGVEFAIHGLVHTDYSQLSLETHLKHINEAIEIFNRHNISFTGFRCPYLRSNENTLNAVRQLGFSWESSDVVAWDVLEPHVLKGNTGLAYGKLLDLYSARLSGSVFSVPTMRDGIVEIPVSIPDDEAIVDRLGLNSATAIARLWLAILEKSFERGDVFTIQLHHERVPLLGQALRLVLRDAFTLWPGVFIASLGEIAGWYRRRDRFSFALKDIGKGCYRIGVSADPDATVLVKNARIEDASSDTWYGRYRVVPVASFTIRSGVRPAIGLDPAVSDTISDFLIGEGFIVEHSHEHHKYAFFISGADAVSLTAGGTIDEVALIEKIETSGAPFVRMWRWPRGNRSAIAITGDIDSITLIDFARRIFEVRDERAA